MGIDRAELYGLANGDGPATPAAAQAAAQVATFRIPRTDPPSAPLSAPFVARSLALDNVTGRWWRVAGRWIPPWTVGAIVAVDPPGAQLEVEAATPTGQLSEAIGDELVIVASSAAQPLSAGIYRPPTVAIAYESVRDTLDYGMASSADLLVAPAAGQRVAIVSAAISTESDEGSGLGTRGPVGVSFRNFPGGQTLYEATLSPMLSTVQLQAPPGAILSAPDEGVEWIASGDLSAGGGLLGCWLLFYRVATA